MSGAAGSSAAATVQEYTVRVPKVATKQNRVMQFNSSLLVDFTKWSQVKMVREVPVKSEQGPEEPKSGAGSEYGKELREEARRKKLGIVTKKRSTDSFPWLMKVGGKNGKKYRGVRGGSVTENASYYVFTQAKDGAFEAYPITEWYTFQPIQRYKALSAEEAEEQFNKRDKIMNYFSVMVKNRLKPDDPLDVDDEDKPAGKGKAGQKKKKKTGDFKLTDMDEWPDSSDDDGEDGDGDAEDGEERKKKKKEAAKAKEQRKKRKKDVKDEAFEDSDDGDDEGRELDYISDSSESEEEQKPEKEERGVDQEDALKRLLDSDAELEESSSEEEKKSDDEEEKEAEDEANAGEKKKKSKKKKKRKEENVKEKEESKSSESDQAADSSDDEVIAEARAKKAAAGGAETGGAPEPGQSPTGGGAGTPAPVGVTTPAKRKVDEAIAAAAASNAKRARTEAATAALPSAAVVSETGITEEAVRRYLTRKPMTTTELLQKFKSKKVGLSSDQLVPVIAQILKKINPNKQTVKGKMYLSIKK